MSTDPPCHRLISRRSFLATLSAGALSLPFLRKGAFAAEGDKPLRLICFPMINGAPCGGEVGNLPHHLFWPANMGALSPVTEPLAPHADKLTFVKGLWLDGAFNHSAIRSLYTGAYLGVNDYDNPKVEVASIDQIIADHIQQGANPAPLRSLHLAAAPADHIGLYKGGRSTFFFGQGGVALDYEANPVTAYDGLFAADAQLDESEKLVRAHLRERALDLVLADISKLTPRVSNSEREAAKLSRYREALSDLKGDTFDLPSGCEIPVIEAVEGLRPALAGSGEAAYEAQYYPDIVEAQFEIMAHALVCGVTRVATLQVSSADNSLNAVVPVDTAVGTQLALHAASHEVDQDYYGQCQRWFAEKLVRFLDLLNVPDPLCPDGNTVLDNSVILWMSESHPIDHGSHRLPMAYLGGAGGTLVTGTVVDHDPVPAGEVAQAHHDLEAAPSHRTFLNTVCRAFGVSDAATSQFGNDVITEMLT